MASQIFTFLPTFKFQVIDIHGYKIIDLEIGMKVLAEYNRNDAPGVYYTASVAEIPEEQNRCPYFIIIKAMRYSISLNIMSSLFLNKEDKSY